MRNIIFLTFTGEVDKLEEDMATYNQSQIGSFK